MDRIKKNFGFGCMRLPMIGEEVDIEQTKQMVDAFLDAGFNYFDTAHGYIQGKSEKALKPLSAREVHPDRQADGELFQDRGRHPPVFREPAQDLRRRVFRLLSDARAGSCQL